MMNPVPIDVLLLSESESGATASLTSPRTCTTAARARSAKSANADAEIVGLCRGALVHSWGSRSAAAGGTNAAHTNPAATAAGRPTVRRIDEAYAIGRDPTSVRCLIQQVPKLPLLGRRQPLQGCARVARHRRRLLLPLFVRAPDAMPDVARRLPGAVDQLLRFLALADRVQVLEQRARAELVGHAKPGEREQRDQGSAQLDEGEHAPSAQDLIRGPEDDLAPDGDLVTGAQPALQPRDQPPTGQRLFLRSSVDFGKFAQHGGFPSWAARRGRQIFC